MSLRHWSRAWPGRAQSYLPSSSSPSTSSSSFHAVTNRPPFRASSTTGLVHRNLSISSSSLLSTSSSSPLHGTPAFRQYSSAATPYLVKYGSSPVDCLPFNGKLPLQSASDPSILYSHVKSPSNEPLIELSTGQWFHQQVEHYGDKHLLTVKHQGIRYTWLEFREQVEGLARGLLSVGVKPGDRVGVWLPNTAEWITAQFATALIGAVLVNVNPAYRTYELQNALNQVSVTSLIVTPTFLKSNYVEMLSALFPDHLGKGLHVAGNHVVPSLTSIIQTGEEPVPGMHRFKDLVLPAMGAADKQELRQLTDATDANDAYNIQFTSGTTGLPKGATLTHRNILNNGFFVGAHMALGVEDNLCVPVPLYHCFGVVIGNLAAMCHGSSLSYPSAHFDPLATLQCVQEERCTALHGVPTMFIAMLNHPRFREFDLSSLRTGVMAGSPCPEEIMRKVNQRMHMQEVTICYGMTETSPVSFQSHRLDPIQKRVTTIGRIHDHVEVKLVDPTTLETVPVGQAGEICTSGYLLMKGYWNDKKKTDECMRDGWMYTGDLAVMDEEGYVSIVGRSKDVIIRGGENIYPREIEEFLHKHPQIADVHIIGVPDPKFGEVVCAWIVLAEGADLSEQGIQEFCKGRIAHYKVPTYVQFVTDFPKTITGKVQKYLMREQSIKALGLEGAGHAAKGWKQESSK